MSANFGDLKKLRTSVSEIMEKMSFGRLFRMASLRRRSDLRRRNGKPNSFCPPAEMYHWPLFSCIFFVFPSLSPILFKLSCFCSSQLQPPLFSSLRFSRVLALFVLVVIVVVVILLLLLLLLLCLKFLYHQHNTKGLVGDCMLLAPSKITKKKKFAPVLSH